MNRIDYKEIIIGLLVAWAVVIPLVLILALVSGVLNFQWEDTGNFRILGTLPT